VSSHGACAPERSHRPRFEVADIFRAHSEVYRATHPLTPEQRKAAWCIEACRTALLGGHLDVCPDCGHEDKPSYNSCRNRHCPKCQALAQARWLARQQRRILPVPYFHVVFTLPAELRPLALRNRKPIFDLLFTTASRTLLTLGRDPERMGALLGITAVLHTWTRDLRFHPHLHCVVTGGGLALDGDRWLDSDPNFLFPVKVIGKLFRGKVLAGLRRLQQRGGLDFGRDAESPDAIGHLCDELATKKWVVYAKRPFAGPEQVFAYLGHYTHRVAISNYRLVSVTGDEVVVATRDGKTVAMTPNEFIRRFLQHVLPDKFVKIRHYGLMASSNVKTKLRQAQDILASRYPADTSASTGHVADADTDDQQSKTDWRELLLELTGLDLTCCPRCGSRRRRRLSIPAAKQETGQRARAPPPGVSR
jgi:hypothetical protein